MQNKNQTQTGEGNAPRNDPNANYAMYEADRVDKAKAQPKFPSVTGEGNAPRISIDRLAVSDAAAEEIKRRFAEVETQRDELLAEISNLRHDYEIVSTERNNLRSVIDESRRWISGHMGIAGITATKKAEQILAAIAEVEGGAR